MFQREGGICPESHPQGRRVEALSPLVRKRVLQGALGASSTRLWFLPCPRGHAAGSDKGTGWQTELTEMWGDSQSTKLHLMGRQETL